MSTWKNCRCPECMFDRTWRVVFGVLALWALLYAICGCTSTVTPAAVEAHQASFDQGAQNSGLIAMLPGNAGALITPHARDRYNELIGIYGREFLPALPADYGITRDAGGYAITAEALQDFILMNTWHRMGREPKNK